MPMIFKYFSENVIEHVFTRDGFVGIKCSLAQDYNDPFELFLGVNFDQGSDLLATYKEVVQEVPPLLTTCFSRSPVVAPMWAHYANNHRGFVLGFETTLLEGCFEGLMLRDIAYRDEPSTDLVHFVEMAAFRCKPRDAMALRSAVFFHSYFSKYSEWSYEQEARAVNVDDHVENIGGNNILFIPQSCVTDIICGSKAAQDVKSSLLKHSNTLEVELYDERFGRSFPSPYLVSVAGEPKVYSDGIIREPIALCCECSEPLKSDANLCPWCAIDEQDEENAASYNPFRLLDNYGLLQNYMTNFPANVRKPYIKK